MPIQLPAIAAIPKLVAAAASRAAAAVSALVTNAAATFGIGTAIALAAATFISSFISLALTSKAPLKIYGNPIKLLT